jgi:hypothetical protein
MKKAKHRKRVYGPPLQLVKIRTAAMGVPIEAVEEVEERIEVRRPKLHGHKVE